MLQQEGSPPFRAFRPFCVFAPKLITPRSRFGAWSIDQRRGVELVEEWDEPAYVSVKCRDPDGYIVEAAWEPEP